MFTTKSGRKNRGFPYSPVLIRARLLHYHHPPRAIRPLQPVNLHRHTIITRSTEFTLGFTLGCCVGLDKSTTTRVYHCSITQNNFTGLRTFWATPLPLFPSLIPVPQILTNSDLFSIFIFTFSRTFVQLDSNSTHPFLTGFFHLTICI